MATPKMSRPNNLPMLDDSYLNASGKADCRLTPELRPSHIATLQLDSHAVSSSFHMLQVLRRMIAITPNHSRSILLTAYRQLSR